MLQFAQHRNGVNVISLKEIVLKTEPSALMYKLPTAHLNGLTGVSAYTTQLETVYKQGREPLNVVKRVQMLLNVGQARVTAVSNFGVNIS